MRRTANKMLVGRGYYMYAASVLILYKHLWQDTYHSPVGQAM